MRRWLILGALVGCLAASLALGVTSASRTQYHSETRFFSVGTGYTPLDPSQPSNWDAIGYGTWQRLSEKQLKAWFAKYCHPRDVCVVLTQAPQQSTPLRPYQSVQGMWSTGSSRTGR